MKMRKKKKNLLMFTFLIVFYSAVDVDMRLNPLLRREKQIRASALSKKPEQAKAREKRCREKEIVVRKGWCLYQIAEDLGASWKEIAERNQLEDPNKIYPGQKLRVIPFTKTKIKKVSWYGPKFHGRKMANGRIFNMYDPTIVAHKWLPFGTKVLLTSNSRNIIVIVQDRGPYHKNRCFDLSMAAAEKLGIKKKGLAECKVEILN